MSKRESFTDQVRRLIDASEHSRYRIALECGLDHSTMSRFMAGKCRLSMESLDALAAFLDWELTNRNSKRREK